MGIRAEYDFTRREYPGRLIKSCQIPPGVWHSINFLKKTRIATFYSSDSKEGLVSIKGSKENIEVVRFENSDDQEGKIMDVNSPIKVIGEQELIITAETQKSTKEVVIFLNPNNNGNNRNRVDFSQIYSNN